MPHHQVAQRIDQENGVGQVRLRELPPYGLRRLAGRIEHLKPRVLAVGEAGIAAPAAGEQCAVHAVHLVVERQSRLPYHQEGVPARLFARPRTQIDQRPLLAESTAPFGPLLQRQRPHGLEQLAVVAAAGGLPRSAVVHPEGQQQR
jgi:hypothetical protein